MPDTEMQVKTCKCDVTPALTELIIYYREQSHVQIIIIQPGIGWFSGMQQ
jgi:hypothetical protein